MTSTCGVCAVPLEGKGSRTEGAICPRCVTEVFAARFAGQTNIVDDDPTCVWAPEGPRSTRDRLEDLHELGDRSRSSMLPPSPADMAPGEVSLSVRAAIRGVDLFPAASAAAVAAPSESPREREPASSRPRPFTFDRVLLAVAVGGSLVMGYKAGEERVGRSSLSAPALSGKVMAGAGERALRITTRFRLDTTPPPPPEPVVALPEARPASLPAPSWKSHAPGTKGSFSPVAKAPAAAAAPEEAAPASEPEEPTPSVPPPSLSLVEAMAAAVKANP